MRLLLAVLPALAACSGAEGPRVAMDFERPEFYAAPFPSEDLRRADGTVDLSGFPNPDRIQFIDDVLAQLDGRATGFGTTSTVYFSLTGPIATDRLPSYWSSLEPDSPVFLISVSPGAPDFLERYPEDGHEIMFQTDPPKQQYRSFLQSWLAGTPTVPPGD